MTMALASPWTSLATFTLTGGATSAGISTTPGAFQTTFGGGYWDGFVAKINLTAGAPYGVVSPTTVNFPKYWSVKQAPNNVYVLKNTGNSELIVSSISISGYFALPVNHCASGVQPGTHCDVYVTFTPHAPETETGTLTFLDNASNSPQTVSLSGVGPTPFRQRPLSRPRLKESMLDSQVLSLPRSHL